MNLRVSLLLVTALSWVAVVAAVLLNSEIGAEGRVEQPPFFYTLDSGEMRRISIDSAGQALAFSYREESRRWFIDGMSDVPADLFRWGGITVLLGGPRTQRVLASTIDDPALYGLDNPSARYAVTLRDGTERVLLIGSQTVNGASTYAQLEGFPQLVLVDTSWSEVLNRLATDPPVPKWLYNLVPDQAREILFFVDNDVIRAYGFDDDLEAWHVCDLPIQGDPCLGTTPADQDALMAALEFIADRQVLGAAALNLPDEKDHDQYGTDRDAPYMTIRTEVRTARNITEVTRITMTIGDVAEEGVSRYAVAMETSDVILIDIEWAEQVLELFHGDLLVADQG